ncbi:MAG: hypothetical protein ACLUFN_04795 [Eubacterium sp.]
MKMDTDNLIDKFIKELEDSTISKGFLQHNNGTCLDDEAMDAILQAVPIFADLLKDSDKEKFDNE